MTQEVALKAASSFRAQEKAERRGQAWTLMFFNPYDKDSQAFEIP